MPFNIMDSERKQKRVLPVGEIVGFVDPELRAYRIKLELIKPKEESTSVAALKSEQLNLGDAAKPTTHAKTR